MPRPTLSSLERERGRQLGNQFRQARGTRSAVDVAAAAGVPLDTFRKIEQGAVAAPGFFLVVRIAAELGLTLDELASMDIGTKS